MHSILDRVLAVCLDESYLIGHCPKLSPADSQPTSVTSVTSAVTSLISLPPELRLIIHSHLAYNDIHTLRCSSLLFSNMSIQISLQFGRMAGKGDFVEIVDDGRYRESIDIRTGIVGATISNAIGNGV